MNETPEGAAVKASRVFKLILIALVGFSWNCGATQQPGGVIRRFTKMESQTPRELPSIRPPESVSNVEIWAARARKYQLEILHGDDLIAKNVYELDPHGFRVVPFTTAIQKNRHLIVAGCSFVYGIGVDGDQTLPFHLAKALPNWKVLNIARGGGSVIEPMYLFRNFDVRSLDLPDEGLLVYHLLPNHVERIIPTWRVLQWQIGDFPHYELRNGNVEFAGTIGERASWKFAQIIKRRGLDYWWLRMTGLYTDWETSSSEEKLLAYLRELKNQYNKQFPKGKMVVVSFLNHPLVEPYFDEESFRSKLAAEGILVWQTQEKRKDWKSLFIPFDGHPTPKGHEAQAEKLLVAGAEYFEN
jgi:hypothetical protein